MFSQWAVEVLKTLTTHVPPRLRLVYPLRFITDLLFAITVFFWFNRRPLTNYNGSFFSQLVYLVQLIKVVYTLRFLLVELVFRELRTFFCFISPLVTKLSIVRKWQTADPCVLKVVNLTFFLVFIIANFMLAFSIEWIGRSLWGWLKDCSDCRNIIFYLPNTLLPKGQTRRRSKKSPRYRIRGKKRSASCLRPQTGSLFRTFSARNIWNRVTAKGSDSSCTSSSATRERSFLRESLPKGYRVFEAKTRSGRVLSDESSR